MSPISLYLNFVLHAVLGKLAEADWLMVRHGDEIRMVARALAARFPVAVKPLHRGLLLVPGEFEFSPTGEGHEFTSWSESERVAQWFADPLSVMNKYMHEARPKARGYMLSPTETPLVLFHHSWAALQDLPSLALQHPHMGAEGARQVAWSLSTQQEVITDPLKSWPELRQVSGLPTNELDRELAPPWFAHESVTIISAG